MHAIPSPATYLHCQLQPVTSMLHLNAACSLQVAGNYVTAPVLRQPRGVVHFLGGAFAGAAPQLAYQALINWVAEAGYTVVATPYAVTFRHLDCATRVHQVKLDVISCCSTIGRDTLQAVCCDASSFVGIEMSCLVRWEEAHSPMHP